jgi:putative transposase
MRIRRLNHSTYQAQYHLVWGTKYRRKWIKDYVKVELIKVLYKTQRRHPAWYFQAINTDQDHIHIQMEIPPSDSVAEVVQELKACSSSLLKKRFPFIQRMYSQTKSGGIWATGYFFSTIGLNEETIRKYIQMQGQEELPLDVTNEFSLALGPAGPKETPHDRRKCGEYVTC